MPVKLVIFDLDETLVHASVEPLPYVENLKVGDYFVYFRPHVFELLKFASSRYSVAVWSSASSNYVEAVTNALFRDMGPAMFCWDIRKCVQKVDARTNSYIYIKDLRKVMKHGFQIDEIVIVDDSPEKVQRQPRSHLVVKPFFGHQQDQELLTIITMLGTLNS